MFGPTGFSDRLFDLDHGNVVFSVLAATFAVPASGGTLTEPLDPHHRKFDAYAFLSPQIDGPSVVFGGAAKPLRGGGYDLAGLYSFNLTPRALIKLVDSNTPVPGGTGKFQINGISWTVSSGNVVFLGIDAATGRKGLYLVSTAGGPITEIIREGGRLPSGRVVIGFPGAPPIQPDSLSGNSLAFRVDFNDSVRGFGNGIYLVSWR